MSDFALGALAMFVGGVLLLVVFFGVYLNVWVYGGWGDWWYEREHRRTGK
jgi:hypothetical protein